MKSLAVIFVSIVLHAVFAPAVRAEQSHFVVIGGLGGEPSYEKRFSGHVSDLEEICKRTAGDDSLVYALSGSGARRKAVEDLFERLREATSPGDAVVVFLIGHGTYDGHDYKFNLPGPDISAGRLNKLLDALPARRQLIVNTTSASGASIELLKSERRIVITATKSGRERNATVFAQFWAEALKDPQADTDKNETISALEAFRYAEQKVKSFYEKEKRLATEHPRLEGERAGNFTLARLGTALRAADDPALRELFLAREALEREIEELKLRKSTLPSEEYFRELEKLLRELAKTQDEIEESVQPE